MIEKCKKCHGQPPRRNTPKCGTCLGSGKVEVIRDANSRIVSIAPAAVQP